MKKEELDEYLNSIGGLINGWNTKDKPIVNSYYFDCESGWYSLIHSLISDLIELGWDKQITQVKEKFGGLRFYINSGSEEIYNRIMEAENESYNICETCGINGKIRTDIGWFRTLCEEHYMEIKQKK